MMNPLIAHFHALAPLSSESRRLMEAHLEETALKKGDYFLEAGQVCDRIGFVREGVLRMYFINEDGEAFTHWFVQEGGFVTELDSYRQQTRTSAWIVAETDCTLTTFSRATDALFGEKVPRWRERIARISEEVLVEKALEKSLLLNWDATARYLAFAERHPGLIRRVPLVTIASYLGITKHSLSRIRRKLARS